MIFGYFHHPHVPYLSTVIGLGSRKGLKVLFLSTMVRTAAVSLLSLFSSVYIVQTYLDRGYELRLALIVSAVFYLILFVTKMIFLLVAENLSFRVGFMRVGALSFIPYILFMWMFSGIDGGVWRLWVSGMLWGVSISLYWWAYHGLFIKHGSKDHFGRSIGEVGLLSTAVAVVVPLLGAVIIERLGYDYVFGLSSVVMVVSAVILLFGPDGKQDFDVRVSEIWGVMLEKKREVAGYAGNAFEGTVYLVVWPVVVYFLFGGVMSLGGIISMATLLAAFFTLLVGRRVDKVGEKKVIAVGVPYVALSWVIRFLSKGIWAFVAVDTVWKLGQGMIGLPMNVRAYKKALSGGVGRAILFRDWSLFLGNFVALVFLIVWFWFDMEPVGTFLVAAAFSLLPLFMVKDGADE